MMKFLFVLIFALSSLTSFASLQSINQLKSPYKLGELPFSAKSLEPFIDEETVIIHYEKHHKGYVEKLNKAQKTEKVSLYDLILHASNQTEEVRNNAGGHWNHTFFWSVLSGDKENHKMSDLLRKDLEKKFGTLENFKTEFQKMGETFFGSGWLWLIRNPSGELQLTVTSNQDNPMMDLSVMRGVPILGIDLWEHAYYLKYKNLRDKYLQSFWKIVNWKQVSEYDEEAKLMKLTNNP
mgnify:CR=1 FL=1